MFFMIVAWTLKKMSNTNETRLKILEMFKSLDLLD